MGGSRIGPPVVGVGDDGDDAVAAYVGRHGGDAIVGNAHRQVRRVCRHGGGLGGGVVNLDQVAQRDGGCRRNDDHCVGRAAVVDRVGDRADDGVAARVGRGAGTAVVGHAHRHIRRVRRHGDGPGCAVVNLAQVAELDRGSARVGPEAVGDGVVGGAGRADAGLPGRVRQGIHPTGGRAAFGPEDTTHTCHRRPPQAQHQVQRGFLLDVVIRQRSAILQFLPGEDEPLLVRRDAFLVLDLRFHILNGVAGLDLQGDGFAGEGLDEDLHRGRSERSAEQDHHRQPEGTTTEYRVSFHSIFGKHIGSCSAGTLAITAGRAP